MGGAAAFAVPMAAVPTIPYAGLYSWPAAPTSMYTVDFSDVLLAARRAFVVTNMTTGRQEMHPYPEGFFGPAPDA